MDSSILEKQFARMGARFKSGHLNPFDRNGLTVARDSSGEFFMYRPSAGIETKLSVINVDPADRHLLLMMKRGKDKAKFLCGHDERQWFVATVPTNVTTVAKAMEALKPQPIQQAQRSSTADIQGKRRRRNKVYVRQGEWFFQPVDIKVEPLLILKNEPIQRGRGKPHMCEFLTRKNGETVYVSDLEPQGISADAYAQMPSERRRRTWWTPRRRDAIVYVKGRITHSDHSVVVLNDWHRVLLNTEGQVRSSFATNNMAFLD